MDFLSFIMIGLAVWRVSSLFVREDGPGRVFVRLRESVGIEHDDDGSVFMVPDRFLAGILSCVWCCSIWVAFGFIILFFVSPIFCFYVSLGFSLSAVAILFNGIV